MACKLHPGHPEEEIFTCGRCIEEAFALLDAQRSESDELERRVLELDAEICATVGETGEREKRRAILRRVLRTLR